MKPTLSAYVDISEQEKQEIRDAGFSEEDIGISVLLKNGCPDGDIIHLGLNQLEGESDEAYDARYKAAIERGDYLCPQPKPADGPIE